MYAYNYLQSHRYLKILYQWLCCLFTVQCRQLNEPIQESCRIIYGHSIYDFFHTFIIIDVSWFNLKIGIYVGKESFFFLNWRISSYKSYLITYIYVRIYQSKKLQYFHILRCLLQHSWNYLLSVWLEKSWLIFSGLIVIFFIRFCYNSMKCYNKKYQIQSWHGQKPRNVWISEPDFFSTQTPSSSMYIIMNSI